MFGHARELLDILKTASSQWVEHKGPQLGASLAFYSVLSLAPLVVFCLALAAVVFDREQATTALIAQVKTVVGRDGAEAIHGMIEHAQEPKTGAVATIFGIATLLFGASGVFGQLQDAMNTIWEVPRREGLGLWAMIRSRFLSFGMVLGTGFLLLVTLILNAVISGVFSHLGREWSGLEPLSHFLNDGITFLVITVLFALIFKVLPETKIAWRHVWVGALITTALFTIGKSLFGLYLGRIALGSAYGAAGSLVVLLVWIYYSAQILLFGAELTQVRARRASGLQVSHPLVLPSAQRSSVH